MYGENTKTIAIPVYKVATTVPCDTTAPCDKKVFRMIVTHYFSLGLKTLGPWVRNLAHLLCSSIYTIIKFI